MIFHDRRLYLYFRVFSSIASLYPLVVSNTPPPPSCDKANISPGIAKLLLGRRGNCLWLKTTAWSIKIKTTSTERKNKFKKIFEKRTGDRKKISERGGINTYQKCSHSSSKYWISREPKEHNHKNKIYCTPKELIPQAQTVNSESY